MLMVSVFFGPVKYCQIETGLTLMPVIIFITMFLKSVHVLVLSNIVRLQQSPHQRLSSYSASSIITLQNWSQLIFHSMPSFVMASV